MQESLSFESLPQAVKMLTDEVSALKNLLINQQGEKKPNEPEQPLGVQEAAKILNLSVPTIYSKVSRGELGVMKRGKRLYFFRSELLEYIKGGRKKSIAELEQEAETDLLNNKNGLNDGN